MAVIPYGKQSVSEDDIKAVVDVLRSDRITQGPVVPAFEENVARYCGADYAVAVNSATSALHIACLALGVGKGDIVWTSPITFVASANCALYCGAEVDFVDIDPLTNNMSSARLEEKLVQAQKSNRLPKVVIPVHFCGQSCDMEAIHALGQQYGFRIIEDASHAIGGRYKEKAIGNCQYSDITVFSFHPVKIITTGEGGMALTNDVHIARHMQLLRSHGITRNTSEMSGSPDGPWYYQQVELGFNYRMTDIQAALGLSQMRRLDEFVDRRHYLADRYDKLMSLFPVEIPRHHPDIYSSRHLYVVRLQLGEVGKNHLQVFEAMRKAGIGVNLHYIPVYHQPYYADLGFEQGLCPEAERYYHEALSLPIFPDLTEEDQDLVVAAFQESLRK